VQWCPTLGVECDRYIIAVRGHVVYVHVYVYVYVYA
jgi:hypothetical protein